MDTVLNLGLNEDSLKGLAHQTGDDMRFANDAYRRFIQMFGKIVIDIPGEAFEHVLDEAKDRKGPGSQDTDLDADDLRELIGHFLPAAEGADVVAGIRNTLPLAELARIDPTSYNGLRDVMRTLEGHYRDMCDSEFTIEKGRLWILQTRVGKRTAFGEWVMAHDMLEEGLIDADTALLRVDANRLEELFKRVISSKAASSAEPIATGLNASPGAASGRVVFSADEAQEWGSRGEKVILVRRETTPDDYHGMIASQGILT